MSNEFSDQLENLKDLLVNTQKVRKKDDLFFSCMLLVNIDLVRPISHTRLKEIRERLGCMSKPCVNCSMHLDSISTLDEGIKQIKMLELLDE